MSKKIKVCVAEDHDLVRQGLVSLLETEDNLEICFSVSNGKELVNELEKTNVDVVLLDLEMPVMNGFEVLQVINESYPTLKAIVISMHLNESIITGLIQSGAKGFLPKNADIELVVKGINQVMEYGYYVDNNFSKSLIENLHLAEDTARIKYDQNLTEREIQIVKLVCQEKTNKEIAEELSISMRTVEVHRKKISAKIGCKNVVGLVKYALHFGIYHVNT